MTITSTASAPVDPAPAGPPSAPHSLFGRLFDVVHEAQSYRNLAYLLLGLPLGVIWFTVLATGLSVGTSLLVVALVGIPVLVALAYVARAAANVERRVASVLLHEALPPAPLAGPPGNLWVRLRTMGTDRDRWREVGFLLLRLPVGVATFTAAVAAITVPVAVAWAPFHVRIDDHPFGDWAHSARMEEVASSPWAWFLVPLGMCLFVGAIHVLNALARACGRWTGAWLGTSPA